MPDPEGMKPYWDIGKVFERLIEDVTDKTVSQESSYEADVVRRIYRQFLEGYSPKMIADGLMEDGICTPSGGKKFILAYAFHDVL